MQYKLSISYLEIYNEQIRDLLSNNSNALMIVEDPNKGVIVPDLIEVTIDKDFDANSLLIQGNSKRAMATTNSNQFSSRSHALLQINLEIKRETDLIFSKLCLIDLAGSERGAASECRGQRQIEGSKINQSLLALGNCIKILSDKSKSGAYVPYRDSKLTRMLKDSLGGNTNTSMIACISSLSSAYEETINTLKYAESAKKIKHKVSKNIKNNGIQQSQYQSIIQSLKDEIQCLKTQLKNNQTHTDNVHSIPLDKIMSNDKEIITINEQLVKTQEQKMKLEQELKQSKSQAKLSQEEQSKEASDGDMVDAVSQSLMANFEENWEIKQSINELEELKTKNHATLAILKQNLKDMNPKEGIDELKKSKSEISDLLVNMQSNERIYKELQAALEDNLLQKQKLQSKLMRLQSGKRRDMLELQIVIRMLKLQKLDLEMKNLQMKKENICVVKQNNEQMEEVHKMKEQLNSIQSKLKSTEQMLRESQNIIDKQTVELSQLKRYSYNTKPPNLNAINDYVQPSSKLKKSESVRSSTNNDDHHITKESKASSRHPKSRYGNNSNVLSITYNESEDSSSKISTSIRPQKEKVSGDNNVIHLKLKDILNKENNCPKEAPNTTINIKQSTKEIKGPRLSNEPIKAKELTERNEAIMKMLNYISRVNVNKRTAIDSYIEMKMGQKDQTKRSSTSDKTGRANRLKEMRRIKKEIKKEKENETVCSQSIIE